LSKAKARRAIVENKAILGYFDTRREREVIVDPRRVDDVALVLRPRPTGDS
jgi:hypothetical protein